MTALLEAKGLCKSYGRLAAVQDVSFVIGEGEIVGLIGPNGAGKTTLIGLLSGAISATKGSVLFQGESVLGLAPHRIGRLGIVRTFQLVQPFSQMTVRECVMLGALFGADEGRKPVVADAWREADALLKLVGLSAKAEAQAEQLNIPERKKLEIARSLAARPKLLLLDEVMAGLTGSEIGDILAILRGLPAAGVALVVIEHVMQVVRGVCERLIVLHHGRKIADGAAADVLRDASVAENYMGVAR
jgi:branched-chain amino acid transport system ATP-binding protein